MKKIWTAVMCGALLLGNAGYVSAEEKLEDIFKKVIELKEQGKFTQATAELSWANSELQKLHTEKLKSFLPDQVAALSGGEVEAERALGMVTIKRVYKNNKGGSIALSLTGSEGTSDAATKGFGALAGLAQAAALMEGAGGQSESVRVHSKRATIQDAEGRLKLMLGLNGGMMLMVEQESGKAEKSEIVALAEGVKVDELDSYLMQN